MIKLNVLQNTIYASNLKNKSILSMNLSFYETIIFPNFELKLLRTITNEFTFCLDSPLKCSFYCVKINKYKYQK